MTTDPRGIITDVKNKRSVWPVPPVTELIGATFKGTFHACKRAERGGDLILMRRTSDTHTQYHASTAFIRDRDD